MAEIFSEDVAPVIVTGFDCEQQATLAEPGGAGADGAQIGPRATFGRKACREIGVGTESRRAGGSEIASIGAVGALGIIDVFDCLGDDEVEIEIALAMAVAAIVERHAIEECSEVGAVIEVEAAQEILIGLAAARMLGRNEAGHNLKQFPGALQRTSIEIGAADPAFGRGIGSADKIVGATKHRDHRRNFDGCGFGSDERCDRRCQQHGGR
nr:hypothetical protein [Polymorphobacter multimanifer]